MRAAIRFSWQRLTGVAVGLVIGPSDVADRVARRIATHPEARLQLAGYLAPADAEARPRPLCRGSARSTTSPGSPRSRASNG